MATELITLLNIQNRTGADYNFLESADPLSGYEVSTGPPTALVDSFDVTGVTLDVTTFFEGRLCRPEFRLVKDVKVLANIIDNLGSSTSPGPKEFILVSSSDIDAGYLEDKIDDGEGILVSKITDSSGIESLQLDVRVKNSIEIDSDYLQLVNDELAPGNDRFYGTSGVGIKGWYSFTLTDKRVAITALDLASGYLGDKIVGEDGILADIVTDSTGEQTLDFSVLVKNSIEIDSDYLQLINDNNAPGNSKFYGTTTLGVKGWQSLPTKNSIEENAAELQLVSDELAPGNSKFYGTTILGVKGWQSLPIKNSIVEDLAELQLVNDSNAPGNSKFYGTSVAGVKGWQPITNVVSITVGDAYGDYLDDKIVGGDGILTSITTESNGSQTLDLSVLVKNSIIITSDYLQLINDENVPGNLHFYGTNNVGAKGWHAFTEPVDASNVDIDTGTETVDSFADTSGEGVFWFYVVIDNDDATNRRAGQVIATWDATNDTIEYTESSTLDVGDTSDIVLTADIDTNNIRLRATAGSDNWTVRCKRMVL